MLLHVVTNTWDIAVRGGGQCVSTVLERMVESDERLGKSVHLVADAKLSPVWVKATPHSRAEVAREDSFYAHRQVQTQQMIWHLASLGSLTC